LEYYFDSEEFKDSSIYKNFININDSNGILKIEASTASGAYPLVGVSIVISKMLDGNKVIFYEGKTNDSGIIESIILPTRSIKGEINEASDILFTTYDLDAYYEEFNVSKKYDVSIFDNVKVIQPVVFAIDELAQGEENGKQS
jgi:hypothetical protein